MEIKRRDQSPNAHLCVDSVTDCRHFVHARTTVVRIVFRVSISGQIRTPRDVRQCPYIVRYTVESVGLSTTTTIIIIIICCGYAETVANVNSDIAINKRARFDDPSKNWSTISDGTRSPRAFTVNYWLLSFYKCFFYFCTKANVFALGIVVLGVPFLTQNTSSPKPSQRVADIELDGVEGVDGVEIHGK